MKKIFFETIIFLIMLSFIFSGCAFVNVQTPLDTNFSKTELGTKQGKATSYSLLWLVAWGNSGSRAAADNGNLKIIRHADRKVISVLFGLYTHTTIIVYGD